MVFSCPDQDQGRKAILFSGDPHDFIVAEYSALSELYPRIYDIAPLGKCQNPGQKNKIKTITSWLVIDALIILSIWYIYTCMVCFITFKQRREGPLKSGYRNTALPSSNNYK